MLRQINLTEIIGHSSDNQQPYSNPQDYTVSCLIIYVNCCDQNESILPKFSPTPNKTVLIYLGIESKFNTSPLNLVVYLNKHYIFR